jgi:hypothetical protein
MSRSAARVRSSALFFAAIADKVLRAWERLLTVSNARLIPPRSAKSLSTNAPNIAVAPIVSEKLA